MADTILRMSAKEKRVLPLLLILFVGLALRVYIVAASPAVELDGIGYATMADQFARGLFGPALNNVFPPVYPLFVGLFHLVLPDVEVAGRLVSLVFGMLLIYVSFLFVKRLSGSRDKALWVAFLLALQPYLVRYSGTVLSESCATFLFTVTLFAFYVGWREERRGCIALSGLCLTLTYLTRPEYLVFYAPFILILLAGRRVRDSFLFLLPFLALGFLYMSYLWWQTGMWMVSRKVTLWPFVPLRAFFGNVPLVAYEFFIAIFPPFFVCALFGIRRVEKPYRNLVLLLVAFHVVSLSFVSHATRRYSVEFIPVSMIFVVEGVYAVNAYLAGFFRKAARHGLPSAAVIRAAMVALIVAAAVFQAFAPPRYERALHKKAGLFLLHYQPGSVVASRLPLVAFYENGTSVDLMSEMSEEKDLAHFKRVIAEKKVDYLIFDEEVEEALPFLKAYLSRSVPVYSAAFRGTFVRVYRL
jgi:4-amino-4-deoxy-L-arabinose transferase-like glycosyltransferase